MIDPAGESGDYWPHFHRWERITGRIIYHNSGKFCALQLSKRLRDGASQLGFACQEHPRDVVKIIKNSDSAAQKFKNVN